jgi:hypothetical protein
MTGSGQAAVSDVGDRGRLTPMTKEAQRFPLRLSADETRGFQRTSRNELCQLWRGGGLVV